jgi:hypothetical protein
MFTSPGRLMMRVLKITFRLEALFISLNTLKIRKALIIVKMPFRLKVFDSVKSMLIRDNRTMLKSNLFQPSQK